MARRTPATTPEQEENRLIAAAVKLAHQQLEDGTASAQVITHFLKLGSSREKIEQELMEKRRDLLEAQKEALAAQGQLAGLIEDAVTAFKTYVSGSPAEYTELPYEQGS